MTKQDVATTSGTHWDISEISTAVTVQIAFVWFVTPCGMTNIYIVPESNVEHISSKRGQICPRTHSALLCLLMHILKSSSKQTRVRCERLSDSPIARNRRGRTRLCFARCACTGRARVYRLETSARSRHACTGWCPYATVACGFGYFGLSFILYYNRVKSRFSEPSEKCLLTSLFHLQTRM
jgi:hypothetical protein